jgi:glycosyltransferase involved in cell wall biosynthesis
MNEQPPVLSVGMPVYNGEQWLNTAIESILNQSYSDFEFIISDNASTDKTQDICEHYAKIDNRVRYIRNEKNLGANPNFNKVFTESRGRYFKWASSNDLLHEDMLKKCVAVLEEKSDVVLCFPNTKLFYDADGEFEEYDDLFSLTSEQPEKRFRNLVENLGLNNTMNGVIRSSALAKTELIKVYFSSDNVLMAELALHGKLINLPDFLFYRRMDRETATALMEDEELVKHYHPDSSSKMIFQQWIIHFNYMKVVFRTSIPWLSKLKCAAYVVKNIIWHRRDLFEDLKFSLKALSERFKKRGAVSPAASA